MNSRYRVEISKNKNILKNVILSISKLGLDEKDKIEHIFQKNVSSEGKIFSKTQVLFSYKEIIKEDKNFLSSKQKQNFLENIRMKKIRTISGVTPVTVLTKPYPCPGQCIFCPNDPTMPKSYLPQEPGAQRAYSNFFDPYHQTFNRLIALKNMGHPTDKVELIILGGTWTSYPLSYQKWFIKKCFDALNNFDPNMEYEYLSPASNLPYSNELLNKNKNKNYSYNQNVVLASNIKHNRLIETETWNDLILSHKKNEKAKSRCVGLVLETRPDEITENEIYRLRKLGATKIQIGIQTTNNVVLKANKRGHTSSQAKKAVDLLRLAGFKIHAHWMPNLYRSTVRMDKKDFNNLFSGSNIKPDELKVYPCSLIAGTKLVDLYKKRKWKPYSYEQLVDVLTYVFQKTPRYCRITRVIRDIPGNDIVIGNKVTNLRQIIENKLKKNNTFINEIRFREIKDKPVRIEDLKINEFWYKTSSTNEVFLEYITKEGKIAGFLRLSLPKKTSFVNELKNSAIIREVHIYGQSIEIGKTDYEKVQHSGLGKNLINYAELLAKNNGFTKISVISSIGTRNYYRKLGFSKCDGIKTLYQKKSL